MKRILSFVMSLALFCGILSMNSFASEAHGQADKIKTVMVDMNDVMTLAAKNSSKTMTLSRDMASKNGIGSVTSVGQFVDLRTVIPSGSQIVSITMYCPTNVKVTQSPFTAITNWVVQGTQGTCSIPFARTNSATANCKSTVLAGDAANVKFMVTIQGTIFQNQSGFDGFTVNGGAKMIIEYK